MKTLNRFLYRFLKRELEEASEKNIITDEKVRAIMDQYEEGGGLNAIWVIAAVGGLLVGLGFLLVVANNWDAISNLAKLAIIIGSTLAALFGAIKAEPINKYTSKGLYYLSVIIYGSGIFLVVDAYNLDVLSSTSLFLWALGALGLSVYKKEILLLIAAHVLVLIGIMTGFDDFIVVHIILMLGLLTAANHYFAYRSIVLYFLIAAVLLSLFYFPAHYQWNSLAPMFFFIALGNAMLYLKQPLKTEAFKRMGLVTQGIAGFVLSFADTWETVDFISDGSVLSVVFSILFIAYMLYLLTHKRLIPLIIVSMFIIRYYFDSFYDFLPRALFFVVGGLLLIGIGFFIERYYEKLSKNS
ncbi:MAG: DUF2157 domain-containing protein [Candidatus Izemoplasmataceae bacterium]